MLKIIVCVKQVPDSTAIRIDPRTNTLIREGAASVINPFDENAVEEALRLRERHGGSVTVISMGPGQAKEALRETLAMGADRAVLISDPRFAGSDTYATSHTLAAAIRKIGEFDLIITGKQAFDGDTAQVGPGLAEQLGVGLAAYVRKIAVNEGSTERPGHAENVTVERMTDEGYEVIEIGLPLVITVVKEINAPRLPNLRGKLAAKKMEIPVWTADEIKPDPGKIGLKGSPTAVKRVFSPEPRGGGEILAGNLKEKVHALISRLADANLV